MTTTAIPELFAVDGELVSEALRAAEKQLDGADGEVALDFSSVRRIGPSGLKALEAFAAKADEKAVKVVLCGVNVSVYKVLKLAKVTQRFSFVA